MRVIDHDQIREVSLDSSEVLLHNIEVKIFVTVFPEKFLLKDLFMRIQYLNNLLGIVSIACGEQMHIGYL